MLGGYPGIPSEGDRQAVLVLGLGELQAVRFEWDVG